MRDDETGVAEKGVDARSRILAAASQSFQKQGFRRTSMDAIANAARMSKRTLYACFSDKHAVLEEVLADFITRRFEAIGQLTLQSASCRDALIIIGKELQRASNDDTSMAMYRVLIAEAEHLPMLTESANRLGVLQVQDLIRKPLGDLGVADTALAARVFYDLLVLAPLHRRLMKMHDAPMDAERVVDLVVAGMSAELVE